MVRVVEVNGYKIEPRANLTSADLSNTNLADSDLAGAYLTYADLRGANLIGETMPKGTFDDYL